MPMKGKTSEQGNPSVDLILLTLLEWDSKWLILFNSLSCGFYTVHTVFGSEGQISSLGTQAFFAGSVLKLTTHLRLVSDTAREMVFSQTGGMFMDHSFSQEQHVHFPESRSVHEISRDINK